LKKEESPQQKIQKQIMQKETRRKKLRDTFSRPAIVGSPRKSKKLFEEYQRLTDEIEELEKQLSEYAQ
jgi:hypothetical protein